MCGRYLFSNDTHATLKKIKRHYQEHLSSELFNQISFEEIYPSQKTVVFLFNEKTQQLSPLIMKWGLSLHHKQVINLRNENHIAQKYKPCLIIASGYYEWDKSTQRKCFFTSKKGIVYMVGCYNEHHEFAIVTEETSPHQSNIHTRTPLSIKKEDIEAYFQNKLVSSNQYEIEVQNQFASIDQNTFTS